MAATRKARRRTTKRRSTSSRGRSASASDRVNASLDASGVALRELRDELRKRGSTLLKDAQLRDVEKFVKDAGTGFRGVSKRLAKDLEGVQKAATTGRKTTKRKATKKKATKR